ncbi:exodeoxyribonuclease VII large subunit [Parabacteroides pacaensis]|uniref:exodeoxyribonuclease VII large subunit n=1 Tax=Parabacteroides pacaensis TaxID=2086575 RepID=UPI000D0EA767|nr:exodeoxyribonuclease VII large subunit [Parabacteroides pacaensis]
MERKEYSLLELNGLVKSTIRNTFPDTCWVRAEMSDVRVNMSSGHCYLEFIEKNPVTGQTIAKAKASIWAKTFRMLKPYFESETGQTFTSGLKVLVKVSVDFHELYGFNLTILDIDPTYTLGDLIRRRMEIIRQLQEEGVYSLNKELKFPALPQRIAVITSPTAAGYEDFLNQLSHNKRGYVFYPKLFPAVMQGEKTEESIIDALDRIYLHTDKFDVVVIIRGGGATSDLNSFDSYSLACNCAQFPLPIITGIGHERDDTVIDLIAHTRAKTPTAVAEFLISSVEEAENRLLLLQQSCIELTKESLHEKQIFLQGIGLRLPALASRLLEKHQAGLRLIGQKFPGLVTNCMDRKCNELDTISLRIKGASNSLLNKKKNELQLTEQFIQMTSPEYILKRGYTLTIKNGKIIKHITEVSCGDEITTRFADGEVQSRIL